jgi:chloramphenicol-sensitive protein RarD
VTDARRGMLFAIGAYLAWGVSPLYWKLLKAIPAVELLAHRIVWCALLLAGYLLIEGRFHELRPVVRSGRALAALAASTACIAFNWFVYIWAINNDHLLDASFGYYVNPLVSVLLGRVFLGERLNRLQGLSVAVAGLGVGILAVGYGRLPWISLALAVTFAFYGLLRKTMPAGPEAGLMVEVAALSPLMLGVLWRAEAAGTGAWGNAGWATDLLLVAAGVVTAVPLLWFTRGARLLPLSTVGLLQYLAPTLQFALAVAVFGEPFAPRRLAAFLCIWAALAIFTVDARRRQRQRRHEISGAGGGEPLPVSLPPGLGTEEDEPCCVP